MDRLKSLIKAATSPPQAGKSVLLAEQLAEHEAGLRRAQELRAFAAQQQHDGKRLEADVDRHAAMVEALRSWELLTTYQTVMQPRSELRHQIAEATARLTDGDTSRKRYIEQRRRQIDLLGQLREARQDVGALFVPAVLSAHAPTRADHAPAGARADEDAPLAGGARDPEIKVIEVSGLHTDSEEDAFDDASEQDVFGDASEQDVLDDASEQDVFGDASEQDVLDDDAESQMSDARDTRNVK